MRCCSCEKVKPVGCFPHCGVIALPFTAQTDGDHQLIWLHAGVQRHLTLPLVTGEPITFTNDNLFPESATLTFQIIQPDGSPFASPDGSLCFSLRTRVAG